MQFQKTIQIETKPVASFTVDDERTISIHSHSDNDKVFSLILQDSSSNELVADSLRLSDAFNIAFKHCGIVVTVDGDNGGFILKTSLRKFLK
jgi:hypothetical protein